MSSHEPERTATNAVVAAAGSGGTRFEGDSSSSTTVPHSNAASARGGGRGGRGGRSSSRGRGGRGRGRRGGGGRSPFRGGGARGRGRHQHKDSDHPNEDSAAVHDNTDHKEDGAATTTVSSNGHDRSQPHATTREETTRGGEKDTHQHHNNNNKGRGGRGRGRGRHTSRGGRGRGRGQRGASHRASSQHTSEPSGDNVHHEDHAAATTTSVEADEAVRTEPTDDTAACPPTTFESLDTEENAEKAYAQDPPPPSQPAADNLTTFDSRTPNGDDAVDAKSPPTVQTPIGNKNGKFLVLSNSKKGGAKITGTVDHVDKTVVAAGEGGKAKKKASKSKKKKKPAATTTEPPVAVEVDPLSTTDALQALPAQEVSITADTAVKFRTANETANEGTNNNNKPISLLSSKSGSLDSKKSKRSKKKKKGLSGDAQADQMAVQLFNRQVHHCLLQSDADGMRDILHNRTNHNFALDAVVLEAIMNAYVIAAMFEDALYCLRHCTLPGTLSTMQTERILSSLPQNLRNSSAYTAADMLNYLCIATEFDTPTSRTYFLRIVRGISLEFLEEATSARDRICSSPCERLVRSGLCVVNARLERGRKPTDLLVVPGDQLGVFVPDASENRGIQAGDAVSILPYAGPYPFSAESLDRNMIEAVVTNTNPMVLRLQDKANASLYAMFTDQEENNLYRIDKLANRMGFNRQLAAAVAIASPLGDPPVRDPCRPSPELIKAITAMDENIDLVMKSASQGGALPKGEMTSTAALCSQAIPFRADDENQDIDQDAIRSECRLALEKYSALEGLNASQSMGVEGATSNRLTLVQGPPGTGKTAVAIRILSHWARLAAASVGKGETPPPIMATSDSNIAVDNLVEGCANVGLRVVRLGRPEAIRPELLRFCIDRPPSSYSNDGNNSSGPSSMAANRERLKQIKAELKNAQVICCTAIGSGGDILDGMIFERVLVDEATQATEPAVLVPLMRGCRQLVLVGDHCQLPPTVLSTRAEEEGHGVPLFSRMVACGVPPFMLDTQYRMHPRIAMFPSDLFYGGMLKNGVSAPERRPLAGFPWPVEEFPVAFIPIKGVEMDDGVSKYNEDEAAAACNAVAMLMAGGQASVADIAVVTPYAAQAKLIRRMTRRLQENTGPPYIEVSSVDGFQGREKEAVVFSAVRSNDYGAIGFTSDWRRVNVSFTRARRALIVIGNDATLRRGDSDTWAPWLAWADAHGLNVDKPGIPRGRYDPEQLRRVRGGTTAAEMLKDVLKRQQAQLKNAEKQQERAEKNAVGHIRATSENQNDASDSDEKVLTLEEDLAQLENADGNWDDTDDEEVADLRHSTSKTTLTSYSSQDRSGGGDDESSAVVDVWDL